MKRILRKVTTKYVLIFMVLIFLIVFVLGTIVATILSNYSIDVRMEKLTTANILFKSYYQETGDENLESSFRKTDTELKKTLKSVFLSTESCQIIIADETGKIVMHTYKDPQGTGPVIYYFSDFEKEEPPAIDDEGTTEKSTDAKEEDKKEDNKVEEDASSFVNLLKLDTLPKRTIDALTSEGDLSMNNSCYGLFEKSLVWCASPLRNDSQEPCGYIISFTDAVGDGDLFNEMLESISLTAVWLLFVALVAIYVVTYKVMAPLREISNAAKSFARGKYDVRVPERGNDEVADLARSFNKMAIEIQSKDDMQKQFLSSASHDLRTPMTTIAGFIDGILDGAIPPSMHEHYLNIIKSEVQRLSRLVTSLLDISRLQSGARKFDKKPFNICELVRQTIISLENKFNEKGLDVEFEEEKYDMIAIGDIDAINQVVYNVLHNAIKFSYEKSKYKVSIKYSDNDKIMVSVYNEGIGIAGEDIPFVFDRFYKSDKSRGLDKSGVGLGLFISKTIIDAHDGDMSVKSEYGKWCEFTFTLAKGEKSW
ncbi:MAG: HAMP domain-containing histidine kinase [Clostridia bacterium]|nr:HAMP domain-containing histidine kinase [Clostridia bacterium]